MCGCVYFEALLVLLPLWYSSLLPRRRASILAFQVRARDTLYAQIVDADAGIPGAATLDDLVAYAATAKAPPHSGKRGKTEREAETGFAGTLLGGA